MAWKKAFSYNLRIIAMDANAHKIYNLELANPESNHGKTLPRLPFQVALNWPFTVQ